MINNTKGFLAGYNSYGEPVMVDGNVLLIGPVGSGTTYSFVSPNLEQLAKQKKNILYHGNPTTIKSTNVFKDNGYNILKFDLRLLANMPISCPHLLIDYLAFEDQKDYWYDALYGVFDEAVKDIRHKLTPLKIKNALDNFKFKDKPSVPEETALLKLRMMFIIPSDVVKEEEISIEIKQPFVICTGSYSSKALNTYAQYELINNMTAGADVYAIYDLESMYNLPQINAGTSTNYDCHFAGIINSISSLREIGYTNKDAAAFNYTLFYDAKDPATLNYISANTMSIKGKGINVIKPSDISDMRFKKVMLISQFTQPMILYPNLSVYETEKEKAGIREDIVEKALDAVATLFMTISRFIKYVFLISLLAIVLTLWYKETGTFMDYSFTIPAGMSLAQFKQGLCVFVSISLIVFESVKAISTYRLKDALVYILPAIGTFIYFLVRTN